jgi:O-antigen/teichoic acid export membrane protein
VLRFIANAVLLVLLARALGAVELGRFLLATSMAAVFSMFIGFGSRWYITKETSQHPEMAQHLVGEVLNSRFILAVIATLVIGLTINILGYPAKTQLVVGIVWFSVVLASYGFSINSAFRGLHKFEYETLSTFSLNVVQIILVVTFLMLKMGTVAIACAYLLARLVYCLVCLLSFKRHVGPISFKINLRKGFALLSQILSYGLYVIFIKVFLEFTTIFLYQFSGNTGVGYYQAALQVIFATLIFSEILVNSFFPVVSSRWREMSADLNKTATLLIRFLMIIGAYISGFFFVFAPFIIKIVYGPQYRVSAPILKILALAVVLRFLFAALATLLTASGRQKVRTLSAFYGILVIAFLSIWLIPPYGLEGAAIALVISFAVLAAIEVFYVYKTFRRHFFDSHGLLSIILIGMVAFLSNQVREVSPVLALCFYILAAGPLYFSALKKKERREIFSTLQSFRKKDVAKRPFPLA